MKGQGLGVGLGMGTEQGSESRGYLEAQLEICISSAS